MTARAPDIRLTRRYVMSLIRDAEAAAIARTVSLHEMQFETHWVWARGEEYYTEAAMELIAERLRDAHPGAADAIEDAVAVARERMIKSKAARERRKAKAVPRECDISHQRGGYWWLRD